KMKELVRQLGLLPGGQRLSSRLNPATQRLLDVELKRANIPRQNLEPLRPWLAAVTLSVLQLQRAGFDGDAGVDSLFLARAREAKKQVHALETAESQVRLLAELPEPLQELMLRDQLVNMSRNGEQLAFFLEAWANGDGEAVDAAIQQGAKDPELRPFYERVFYERNAQMAEALDALLQAPRTLFVVVGAGHVVGERGVLSHLVRRGYTARQLPRSADAPASGAPSSPEQAAQPAR
ncbi:MAG TPA: TraB/GumN family protein, partial [Aggregicoccus sp.]|nr:TraB/GumN family protein [Aggregicoccus sp.]